MSLTSLRSALVKAFMDANLFPPESVQQENIPFTPPTSGPWAALFFVPNQPTVATLGPVGVGRDEVTGFLQIDLNFPSAQGTKDLEDTFESIRNLFPAGSRFAYSGEFAVIRSCGRSQGRTKSDSFSVTVTVMFYARINR